VNAEEYKKVLQGLLNEQIKHDKSLDLLLSILDRTGVIQLSKAGKYQTAVSSTNKGESAYQRAIINAEVATLGNEQVTWLDIELPVVFQPTRRIDLLGRSSRSHLVLCELKHHGPRINPRSKRKPSGRGSPMYALFELLIYYFFILKHGRGLQEQTSAHTNRKGNWDWMEFKEQANVRLVIAANRNYWVRWENYHRWDQLATRVSAVQARLRNLLAIQFFSTPDPTPPFPEQCKASSGTTFVPAPLKGDWEEIEFK
jgi:hypothetical protein